MSGGHPGDYRLTIVVVVVKARTLLVEPGVFERSFSPGSYLKE
jgi:hypothetical protein